MNWTKSMLSLILFGLACTGVKATHIVGADLTYECINSTTNTYEIQLTMYRDCTPASMAPFDNSITLFILNGDNGQTFTRRDIPKPFATPEIIPADWDVCTGQVYSLCVEFGTYTTTVSLPPRVGGYDIAWSRCCRNNAVTNIVSGPGPNSQGITVLAHVPSADVPGCNSMPIFRQLAPLFLCAGQPFNFDHSALDPDGDSLVYVISNPYSGLNNFGQGTSSQNPTVSFPNNPIGAPPYQNVSYLGGYNYLDPFGTGNFSIDPLSGLLTLTPTQNGLFVFAVSVLEYRNGVLMSENKRDFQINVVTCQPQGTPPVIGSNLSGVPTHSNDTIYVQPLDSFCYDLTLADPSANDTVVLFEVSAPFGIGGTLPAPFAQLTQTGINPVSGQVCWRPSCDYAGLTVNLIVGGQDTSDCKGYNIVFDTVVVVIGGANPPVIRHQLAGGGNSITVDVGESFCYTYTATDIDPNNGVIVTPIEGPFANLGGPGPHATFTANGVNPVTGQICWTATCDYAGQTIPFRLRAADTNYCNVTHGRFDRVDVTVNPTPEVSVTSPIEGCFGSTISLSATATGPGSFSWSPATGLDDPNIANPTLILTTPAQYIVTFTDTFGCDHLDTVNVGVLPLPTVTAAPAPTICFGDTVPLFASGGVAYRWTPAQGLSSTTIANPLAFPLNSTTYRVIVTGANGCEDTAFIDVKVNPLPIVDAGRDTVKCGDNGITLNASGGIVFNWFPMTGLSDPGIFNPVANPDSSTTYYVAITDTNGCTSLDSVFVRTFYADAGPDIPVCIGDSTFLNAAGGIAYQWDPHPTILGALNTLNPLVFTLDTTAYFVTVWDTTGCTDRDTVIVIINPLPITSVSNPDPYVCSGGPTQLTATGGIDYLWTPGSTLDDSTIFNPIARPINPGPNIIDSTWYYVTVTDTNGCVNYDSIGLEVRIRPDIFISRDTFVCPGDTVSVWHRGGFGVINNYWHFNPTLLDSTQDTTLAFPSVSTYYLATVTAVWGCDNTDSVLVYVIDPDAGPDTTICMEDSIRLQGSGGVIYQWVPSTGLSRDDIPNPMASPTVTTTYTLIVTDSVGCTDSATMTITVLPLPPANAGPDTAICIGKSVRLQASGGVDYVWTPSTGLSDDSIADPVADPVVTTLYTVTVTDTNGCFDTDDLLLTVNDLPIVDAGLDTIICRKQPAYLRATGASQYIWTPTTGLSDPNNANPLATPDFTQRYKVLGIDGNGCENTDSILVTVIQLPEASGSPDTSICKFQVATLSVSGNGYRYLWSNNERTTSIVVTPNDTTTYWVVPYGESNCPGDTVFITVNVEQNLPRAFFDLTPQDGFYPLEVIFNNQSQHATRYLWLFGDDSSSTESDPIHVYRNPGQYAVTLIANNDLDCPDSYTFEFIDALDFEIFFPNAFSPNSDGHNDWFYIPNGAIERLDIKIFNRWGTVVYASVNPDFRWDGRSPDGRDVPEGVYTFRVVATTFNGEQIERAGTITLFR